ncbi:MAG: PAS domain-containing protein [Deltaproteobacteria bacterium]|nr:PAS domain-containing protein [Deltaproteobacteria bacterium]
MIPAAHQTKKLSLPALGLIMASIILAIILGLSTWRNLNREERLMENFLRQEGLTLIRAFEAGTRTAMMMDWGDNSLANLVQETARSKSVAYIVITDASGRQLTAAGEARRSGDILPVAQVLAQQQPYTRRIKDAAGQELFEVAKEFKPVLPDGDGHKEMMGRWQRWCGMDAGQHGQHGQVERRAIFVGLYTAEFEAVRHGDLRQSLLMGGLLLMLGSTGFYFLFLAQQTRVARTTLANMELYTRNVIDSMPAGLITLDNRGCIVSLNDQAREIFGRQEGPLEGQPLEILTGTGHCEITPLIREGGEFVERPVECRRPDGETVPLKVSASRLKNRDGEPRGTVLIVRDMREIRVMEEALERSRRHAALGRMAAGIAHEIRNPLGTLRGFAQYFAKLGAKDPHAEDYAELMVEEIDRLNRAISALLQFARPREPELTEIELGGLLQRTARLLQDELTARQLSFRLELPTEPVLFHADSDLLTQVLINLLQNAQAATEAGGEICLGARQQAAEIRCWVADNGKGMSPEEQAHMFDPFFTTRKTGTGLGLATVQQIIEQHAGRIEVQSTPGKGTVVTVILPQKGARS